MHEFIAMDERGRMVPKDRAALESAVAAELGRADLRDLRELRLLGVGLLALGRFDEAIEQLKAALEVAGDDGRRAVAVHINLADAYRYAGRFDRAEYHYEYALDLARSAAPELIHFALQHLGKQRLDQGRFPEARHLLCDALHRREELGDRSLIESTLATLRLVNEADAGVQQSR